MTKKLLFNGCSMTSGDAITWTKHYPDIEWGILYHGKSHPKYSFNELVEKNNNYVYNLRRIDNLSGQVSTLTGFSATDLSFDGNSNQNICMSTIGFLSKLSPEERKTYHVCIGWSEIARNFVWHEKVKDFSTINIGSLESPYYKDLVDAIKELLINRTDVEHMLNYFHNIIALQSYLKANDITYTFWNTLVSNDSVNMLDSLNSNTFISYNHKNIFHKNDWIILTETDYPWMLYNWGGHFNPTNFINPTNSHPNLETVIELSKKVAAHVVLQLD